MEVKVDMGRTEGWRYGYLFYFYHINSRTGNYRQQGQDSHKTKLIRKLVSYRRENVDSASGMNLEKFITLGCI